MHALLVATILEPLIFVFDHIMVFFHDVVGSWGLAIIMLTVLIRAALIPLTLKQYHSMQALQRVQPEMKKLQEKYKGDKQRLNQEMMKFYQEHGVNPLASCLPLAAQLPVFISLFYMLRHDLRQDICNQTAKVCSQVPGYEHSAKFLFIPDLTDKATGAVLITLLILYASSQLLSGVMMMATNPDKSQRTMMLVLPLIFVPIVINFPAGVVVYWITTNLWTILQQYIVRRRLGPTLPAIGTATATPATAVAGAGGGGANAGPAAGAGGGSSGGGGLLARARAAVDGSSSSSGGQKPASNGRTATSTPPPPPRKKKKRSGRRR